tara:strand:+ start:423 stop:644 length:222 start_codon:yes stop_codon:yes gene_type:complete
VKNQKLLIYILTFFIILLLGIYQSVGSKRIEKMEREKLIRKLNTCFDLENKINRTIDESLNLVEYCINKYGKK